MWRSGCATWERTPGMSPADANPPINFRREVTFWVAALVIAALALWLLREVLLPFVAGMTLAYMLNPVARRLEHLGVNRLVTTLGIITVVVLFFVLLILLIVPVLASQ